MKTTTTKPKKEKDGRKNNGGARAGAGRKPKEAAKSLRVGTLEALILKDMARHYGLSTRDMFAKLVNDKMSELFDSFSDEELDHFNRSHYADKD